MRMIGKIMGYRRVILSAVTVFAAAALCAYADTSSVIVPAEAVLRIATDPPGAAVAVNGVDYGASPVEITGLDAGQHAIELSLPGHFRRRAVIQLDSAGADLNFELSRPASVTVTTEPEGAKVAINGEDAGTSPIRKDRLRPGEYKVSVSMDGADGMDDIDGADGYERVDTLITLPSGANDTLHLVLTSITPIDDDTSGSTPSQMSIPGMMEAETKTKPAQGKKQWKREAAVIAFFAFIAVVFGVEKSSY